jgi:hypothetical protein
MNGRFVYQPLTCARHPPHESGKTQLCNGLSSKELFAPTGIQTLDLMGVPRSPMHSSYYIFVD